MKVAIVLNTSWNIYNFRMNFLSALKQKGYEIHTIAPVDDFTPRLVEMGCIHHPLKMDSRGANPIKDSALIFELWSIYRKVRPDIILHYTIKPNVYGTLAASILKIPVINNVCGLGTVFLKDNLVSAVAILLYKIAFRFPRKIFFQNPEDLKLFVDRGLTPSNVADLVPGSGIDLQKFKPSIYQRNKKFTFLLVSRLITDKGVMEYISAVKRLKTQGIDAHFQILGPKDPEHKRGIQLPIIEEWIKTDTVEYLGSTTDVRQYIEKADCVVLPSYREGTPRTLLEAASCGKPIIATDVPGCHQVVQHNFNGFLCKIKDEVDLAEKMLAMSLLSDETLKMFGENGRRKMESEFSEGIVIEKYLEALHTLHLKTAS
jgi:glycosyltransferase involved in cell wall biosynthesis